MRPAIDEEGFRECIVEKIDAYHISGYIACKNRFEKSPLGTKPIYDESPLRTKPIRFSTICTRRFQAHQKITCLRRGRSAKPKNLNEVYKGDENEGAS